MLEKKGLVVCLGFVFFCYPFDIRSEELPQGGLDDSLDDLELERLLSTPIESASKTVESLFDAPLSSTVLTREQILRSGARNIPEALRLAPGMIVREQTAGNYSVHIRGLDTVPPNSYVFDYNNNTTLVMIDYRVVYSYFMGSTFWDTLPVEINDVERIEIVRGPSSAMYGPNAVSGVINIITRKPQQAGWYSSANIQVEPTADQVILGAAAGYNTGDLQAVLSANYVHMDRNQTQYYSLTTDKWFDNPEDLPSGFTGQPIADANKRYPHPELALRQCALNLFLDYQPTDLISFELAAGFQDSFSQKSFIDSMYVLMTSNSSQTGYVDFRSQTHGITTHVAYQFGTQSTPTGAMMEVDGENREAYEYDFYTLDADLGYEWRLGDFRLRPEISYRRAVYEGLLLANWVQLGKPGNKEKAFDSFAASLQAEWILWERLRLIAAGRLDYYFDRTEKRFFSPDTDEPQTKEGQALYPSYQFAATFRVWADHLLRAVYARAFGSMGLISSYMNDPSAPPLRRIGNKALDLLRSDNVELGWRSNLTDKIDVDLEIFYSYTTDFHNMYLRKNDLANGQLWFQMNNLDVSTGQLGMTFSLGLSLELVQARIFATIQETRVYDHAPNLLQIFDFEHDPLDPKNQVDLVHKGTPDLFGGAYLHFSPIDDLLVNLNFYYFTRHTFVRADTTVGMLHQAVYQPVEFEVRQNFLVNLCVTYALSEQVRLTLHARNLFNLRNREYIWSDINRAVYLLGLTFHL